MSSFVSYVLISVLSFFSTVLLTKALIPYLRYKKMGQRILEIGPRWHKNKEGTPTMGGLGFLIPTVSLSLLFGVFLLKGVQKDEFRFLILTLLYAISNAAVGFLDDLTKFRKKQNEGLTPRQKVLLQTVFSISYLALLRIFGFVSSSMPLPFSSIWIDFGLGFYFFAAILLVGVVNCANLTDGIDGLATTTAFLIGAFFGVMGILRGETSVIILGGATLGGSLGFLIYNFHPARIFMGDTGSLFLGALLAGCAFQLGSPLLILLVGVLYILEGISVILQVTVFRLTGKRLFRMAPLHHHFEKCGWSEVKILGVFSILTLIGCMGAYFAL
ncbi:MAG: phospho-N-acetylmuramoyl-pentapeptide-transferase [Clostridia bacterium]|nr:phospho-N-acetylmuramoyl-pentapeptide-transferase [Clostridia bacterium]